MIVCGRRYGARLVIEGCEQDVIILSGQQMTSDPHLPDVYARRGPNTLSSVRASLALLFTRTYQYRHPSLRRRISTADRRVRGCLVGLTKRSERALLLWVEDDRVDSVYEVISLRDLLSVASERVGFTAE